MFENDAQLGENVVKDEVPNLKNFDQRLRDEAHEDISLEVPQGEPPAKLKLLPSMEKAASVNLSPWPI